MLTRTLFLKQGKYSYKLEWLDILFQKSIIYIMCRVAGRTVFKEPFTIRTRNTNCHFIIFTSAGSAAVTAIEKDSNNDDNGCLYRTFYAIG